MKNFDDDHLWEEYDEAVAEQNTAKMLAASDAILRRHLPFFVQYASQTSFPQWNGATREDYLAELLAVAASKVPTYSRTMEHARGRAQFVTYVKPYLKLVRYKVEGSRGPIRLGHETVRLAGDARRFIAMEMAAGRAYPSNEQVAKYLSERCGKAVSSARVPRLLSLPYATGILGLDRGYEGGTNNEEVLPEVEEAVQYQVAEPTDPAEIVSDQMEREWVADRVRNAIKALGLDALQTAVLEGRLMREDVTPIEDLAVSFGVTELEVKEVETVLCAILRQMLS